MKRPNGVPPDKKQRNFTDPESRVMGSPKTGYVQGYNAQIGVDAEAQLIVAAGITQCAADNGELIPITKSAQRNTKKQATRVLADSGYKSEKNFQALEAMHIDAHVALGKGEDDPVVANKAGPATERMHRKRRTKRGRKLYKQRKTIVEPVFGWIKSVLGFQAFSMRSLRKVEGEWDLVCLAVNLKRLNGRMEWAT